MVTEFGCENKSLLETKQSSASTRKKNRTMFGLFKNKPDVEDDGIYWDYRRKEVNATIDDKNEKELIVS